MTTIRQEIVGLEPWNKKIIKEMKKIYEQSETLIDVVTGVTNIHSFKMKYLFRSELEGFNVFECVRYDISRKNLLKFTVFKDDYYLNRDNLIINIDNDFKSFYELLVRSKDFESVKYVIEKYKDEINEKYYLDIWLGSYQINFEMVEFVESILEGIGKNESVTTEHKCYSPSENDINRLYVYLIYKLLFYSVEKVFQPDFALTFNSTLNALLKIFKHFIINNSDTFRLMFNKLNLFCNTSIIQIFSKHEYELTEKLYHIINKSPTIKKKHKNIVLKRS